VTPLADQRAGQVVYTNKARCRDCYRCVRVCPVKAIRINKGQALVDESRCISCGTCVRECPQGAKSFRNDLEVAVRLVDGVNLVAASIAPSFVGLFSDAERMRLPSALRLLGFRYVAETANGAYETAQQMAAVCTADRHTPHIGTACPAVVNYIEHYRPELVRFLVPVVSPMIAHARSMKAKLGSAAKVIFIGPCIAKKAEAERKEYTGLVDCVLTFDELKAWFKRTGIVLSACEASGFDEQPAGAARYFPLAGGSIRTAGLDADQLSSESVTVSGFEELKIALDSIPDAGHSLVIEPLFCSMGCINGPVMPTTRNVNSRRQDVLEYAGTYPGRCPDKTPVPDLTAHFSPVPTAGRGQITEEQIRQVLELTGKAQPENQLNCGGCGYASCRDEAIAVIQGMAEPEMCLTYIRRLAEQRTDKIIDTSPNGIIILDEHLNILSMNPAFCRFFMCSKAVYGRHVSYLMDPDLFQRLESGTEERVEAVIRHDRYHLICHEILYRLPEEHQYVGIFADITGIRANQEKLDRIKAETVLQAQGLLERQITMAQDIARLLGESTAQQEELVDKLVHLGEDDEQEPAGSDIPWDTST